MAKKEKAPGKPQVHPLLEKAKSLDAKDELSYLRGKFHIPAPQGLEQAYFCHHIMGLQPKRVRFYLEDIMERWRRNDQQSEMQILNILNEKMAALVGAKANEVMIGHDLPVLATLVSNYFSNKVKIHNIVDQKNGQLSDIKKLVDQGHTKNEIVGLDLSYVVGDLELKLHDWKVDFAIWSGHQFLSGGPRALAGAYIHQRHLEKNPHPLSTSLPSLFACAPLMASLEVLSSVGPKGLEAKKKNLVDFFHTGIKEYAGKKYKLINADSWPNCIVLLEILEKKAEEPSIAMKLKSSGIIVDATVSGQLRFSFSAMANSFEDVAKTVIELL